MHCTTVTLAKLQKRLLFRAPRCARQTNFSLPQVLLKQLGWTVASDTVRLLVLQSLSLKTGDQTSRYAQAARRIRFRTACAVAPFKTAGRGGGTFASSQVDRPQTPLEQLVRGGARVTRTAQLLWSQFLQPGDFVVDATCGNGGDTLWLSRAVGPTGHVLALDIQEEALKSTRHLLDSELPPHLWPKLDLVQDCHSNLKGHLQNAPRLICFNLGYLPWGNKDVRTKPETTVAAVESALSCLAEGGVLSVMSYIGHKGGPEEHEAVTNLLREMPAKQWTVFSNSIVNRCSAPILSVAVKSGEPIEA